MKSQESVIKTCHEKKKTRLRSTKEKISRIGSVVCYFLNIKTERENTKI